MREGGEGTGRDQALLHSGMFGGTTGLRESSLASLCPSIRLITESTTWNPHFQSSPAANHLPANRRLEPASPSRPSPIHKKRSVIATHRRLTAPFVMTPHTPAQPRVFPRHSLESGTTRYKPAAGCLQLDDARSPSTNPPKVAGFSSSRPHSRRTNLRLRRDYRSTDRNKRFRYPRCARRALFFVSN